MGKCSRNVRGSCSGVMSRKTGETVHVENIPGNVWGQLSRGNV